MLLKNFFKDKKYFLILFLLSFMVQEFIVYNVIVHVKKNDTDNYLSFVTPDCETHLKISTTHLTDVSKIFYDLEIDKPEVIEIMYEATQTKDKAKLATLRAELLKKLSPAYNYMKKYYIRQFHFHLPHAISFLRVHKPNEFGDSLVKIRPTIDYVDKYKSPISAFEEGRIFNGFRNVYPLFKGNIFVGTVEISFSFVGMQKLLSKIDATSYLLMMKSSIVEKKVFTCNQSNYKKSPFTAYSFDKKTLNDKMEIGLAEINIINKDIAQQVSVRLAKGNSFSIYYKNKNIYENHSLIISFIAVPNLNDHVVAYIVHYSFGNYLDIILGKVQNLFWLLTLLAFILSTVFAAILANEKRKQKSIHEFAVHDALTGIYNRHGVNELFNQQLEEAKRSKKAFSIIFFDIDFFKRVNDTYGHEIGDYVLVNIAKIISKEIRASDIFARWGGEEFILFLPNTQLEDAVGLAEKLRAVIEEHAFSSIESITCSFGVTAMNEEDTKESLLKRVDTLLYKAKESGRNCVVSDFNLK